MPPADPNHARPWRGLIALNVALLLVLGLLALQPPAGARQAGTRARGEYTMVAGRIQGGNSNCVYVIDAVNQDMIALRWNESKKSLDGIGYRDLRADAQTAPGR